MKIAVVILNWNGKKLLEEFLPSVVENSKEATIYIADNASTDESLTFVSKIFPTVKIIQNSSNWGFAKGYNEALKNVSEELFVLLNSDVEVNNNWLPPLISEFTEDVSLVAAQPKILDYKRKEYFEYAGAAGGFIDALGYPYCRGRIFNTIEKDCGQYDDNQSIFWATGACLVVRREAFWAVGGFDEDFFTHQEEIDLCWRLQSKGGHIKYIGASSVYHVGGATLASENSKKTFYNFRNTLLMLVKNVEGNKILGLILIRLLFDGIAGLRFIIQGKPIHTFAILRAHFSFYKLLPKFLKKRKLYATSYPYFSKKSIVFLYFLNKSLTFNQL